MDEKDIELENEAQAEENTAPEQENTAFEDTGEEQESIAAEDTEAEQENAQADPEEGEGWQFEASAPTLESNLEIGDDYEIELPEESEEKPQEYKEVSQEANDQAGEFKDEVPDDEEEEKVKRNFIVNKKAVKIAVIAAVCACAVAVIAFFGVRFFLYPNSNEIMTPGNLALTVGDQKISVGYYNYYYNMTVESYLDDAASGYSDLKANIDFSQQITTDDDGNEITWEQKFREDTIWQIKYLTAFYEAAIDAGMTLTDELQENVENSIKSIQGNAAQDGISVKDYLAENAGEYCGIKTMRTIFERLYIAQSYYYQMGVKLVANSDEIQKALEENQEDYKAVSFAYIEMPYTENDDIQKVKAKADAYCKEIKSLTDLKNLIPEVCGSLIDQYIAYGYAEDEKAAVKAIADSMEHTFDMAQFKSWFPNNEISDWMYSSDTKVGSVAAFIDKDYSCIDILYKLSGLSLDETEYYSVRHILVMPHSENASEDGTGSATQEYTKEEWDAALKEANRILDEFNATDKSEVSFAELAEKYSEDISSTSAGGYNYYGGQIFKTALGTMVPEFEAWGTDPSRQYGDVGIVESKYGYHIMFFVYDGPSYMFSAKDDADALKMDEFIDSYSVIEHDAMDKTMVAQAQSSQK